MNSLSYGLKPHFFLGDIADLGCRESCSIVCFMHLSAVGLSGKLRRTN